MVKQGRAAIQFLASGRTLQEHHPITKATAQCQCDLKDQFTALLHPSVSDIDPLNFTILELCFAIMDTLDPKPKDAPISDCSWKGYWLNLMEDGDKLGPFSTDWDVPEELKPISKAESEPESEPDEEPWPSCPEDVYPSTRGLAKTLQNLALWTGELCGGSGGLSPHFEYMCPGLRLLRLKHGLDAGPTFPWENSGRPQPCSSELTYPLLLYQKQAWSKGSAPHKHLCNNVDALHQVLGLKEDAREHICGDLQD
ncbi:hypothetical protein B0H14DRAFT_2567105 [Mycena olivaceomarginata]|nr:hypothetical protein B0H14DRAFT_2567105 [Mycena olivaceomarginata]